MVEQQIQQSRHILIVEDDPNIAKLYQEFIEDFNYQTTVCHDGQQALKTFNQTGKDFDLVLTDQSMPGLTGKELCQTLLASHPSLPIIICTGFSDDLSESIADDIGIKCYFNKPVSLSKLITSIDQLLKD